MIAAPTPFESPSSTAPSTAPDDAPGRSGAGKG